MSACCWFLSVRPSLSLSASLGPPTALSICRSEHKANKERRRRRELCNGRAPCSLSSPPLRLTHCHWFCLPEMSPNTVYSNCLEAASKIQEIFSNNKSTRFRDMRKSSPRAVPTKHRLATIFRWAYSFSSRFLRGGVIRAVSGESIMPRRDGDDDDYGFLKGGGGGGGLALHSVSMEMKGKRSRRRMGTGESEGDVDGGGDKFPVLSSPSLSFIRMGKEKAGVMVKRKKILISLQGCPSRGPETERALYFFLLLQRADRRRCRARASLSSPAPVEKAPHSAQTARRVDGDLRCPP